MANILIVGQKELIPNPIFKQDKNMLEIYNALKDGNDIKILFVHKNIKLNEKKEIEKESSENNELFSNVKQFCIREMMKDRLLDKNLNRFIKENNIETIIFMSNYMAKIVMPCIEDSLDKLNIICDLRLTNISDCLQQYKYEKQKDDPKLYGIHKDFKIHFLQLLSILKYTDTIILDENCDTELLKNQKVDNVIFSKQIKDFIKQKDTAKIKEKEYNFIEISIDRNNYSSNKLIDVQTSFDRTKYIVNETQKNNLINDINSIIKENKCDYIFIHSNKIEFLPKTLDMILNYFSSNDNFALTAPVLFYSREKNSLKSYFKNQKLNNFSNWNEDKPLSFSECVVIKKSFFNKVGLFDNRFKTFDYALFDFILRLYQIKAYYCVMNDIVVFKAMNIARQISLFKEDKMFLCEKWGESLFNMGI